MISTRIDHLVVMAPDLDSGVQWCERTLGVSPGPGGEHPLMGTHNRLLKIASKGFEDAYLEIIALKPGMAPQIASGHRRWFDFDDEKLLCRIRQDGPQLVHWVARTPLLDAACAAWQMRDIDRGPAVAASRMTSHGLLQWQITVRADGARLFEGCLPTLIQWGAVHPVQAMGESGVRLVRLRIHHPQAPVLQEAFREVGLSQVEVTPGPAQLAAELATPTGSVVISS